MVKKTLYLLMVIVCCVGVLKTNSSWASVTDGLVAYYPFNGNANDESGNSHNGTIYGNVSFTEGVLGQSTYFDGLGDYIRINPNYSELNNLPFTITSWVKITKIPAFPLSNSAPFIDDDIAGTPHRFIAANNGTGGLVIYFQLGYPNSSNNRNVEINNVDLNRWYHITATLDSSALRLYVDGQLRDEVNASYTQIVPWTNGSMNIGGNSRLGRYLSGYLDEIRVYNRALSVTEIREIAFINADPIVNAGPDITIFSVEQANTIIQGSASDPDGNALTYRWIEGVTVLQDWKNIDSTGATSLNLATLPVLDVGIHNLTLEVNDGKSTVADEMIITISNSAPTVGANGGGTYQINDSVVIGGQVSDFDGDLLYYEWLEESTVLFNGMIQAQTGGNAVSLTPVTIGKMGLGTHTLTLKVNDGINPAVSSSITVVISDTTAPTLAPTPDKTILWPANHKMVPVTIFAYASDDSGGPVTLSVSIVSNEPQEGLGDGDTPQDWTTPVISSNGIITLQLRAERSGKGNGRIYTVTIVATDGVGNASTAMLDILVPHDKGK